MLKFYRISEKYINYLRSKDCRVMDKNNQRINLGVVLKLEEFKYYIPLSNTKGKEKYFLNNTNNIIESFSWDKRIDVILNKKNEKIAMLRYDYMLPVPNSDIMEVDRKKLTGDYKTKVLNEYKFCNDNKEKIKRKALEIYKVRTTLTFNNTDLLPLMEDIKWVGKRKDLRKYKTNLEHIGSGTCDFKILETRLNEWTKLEKS